MSDKTEKQALNKSTVEANIVKAYNRGYSVGFSDAKGKFKVDDINIDDILNKNKNSLEKDR